MLSTNAKEVLARMRARRDAVAGELAAAAREIAREVNAEAKRIMVEEIYSVEIPLKASAEREIRERGAIRRAAGIPRPLSEAARARLGQRASKGKYGQWKRTGALLASEKARARGPVVILVNSRRYASARYFLGTPEGRPIRSKGVRSVQWQAKAVQRMRQRILERRRQAVLRALRG